MEFWPAQSHMTRCSYNITGHRAETTPDIVKEMAASGAVHSHLGHLRVLSVEVAMLGCRVCWNLHWTLLKSFHVFTPFIKIF